MLLAVLLSIGGAFVHAETLDATALSKLPHVTISAVDPGGVAAQYSGVPLAVLLHSAGAPTGDAVKGPPARSYVAVEGSDGYIALYSLAELDTSAMQCAPILADARNNAAIPASLGPFHVVAPCDRTHARWVRNVISLTIVTMPQEKH